MRGWTRKLFVLTALVLLAPLHAYAVGMGTVTVDSYLGAPLDVKVALQATPQELSSLNGTLGTRADYAHLQLPFLALHEKLRFTVDKSDPAHPRLLITTRQPVNEPFLSLPIRISAAGNSIVKEITILLDPPPPHTAAPPPPAPAPKPAPAASAASGVEVLPTGGATPAANPKPTPLPAPPPQPAPANEPRFWRVERGETLYAIARRVRGDTADLGTMARAIFAANRKAFIGGDMNRMRSGVLLVIPAAGDVRELAARVPAPRPTRPAVASATANGGKLHILSPEPATPEPSPAPAQRAAGTPTPGTAELGRLASEAQQQLVALKRENTELRAQVEQLSQQVAEMSKRVMEMPPVATGAAAVQPPSTTGATDTAAAPATTEPEEAAAASPATTGENASSAPVKVETDTPVVPAADVRAPWERLNERDLLWLAIGGGVLFALLVLLIVWVSRRQHREWTDAPKAGRIPR